MSSDFSVISSTLPPSCLGCSLAALRGEGEGVALSDGAGAANLSLGEGTLITSFRVEERVPLGRLLELNP